MCVEKACTRVIHNTEEKRHTCSQKFDSSTRINFKKLSFCKKRSRKPRLKSVRIIQKLPQTGTQNCLGQSKFSVSAKMKSQLLIRSVYMFLKMFK